MANTATCVYVAFLTTVTTPDIPHNEGVYRPVHITAPEGSVVNPRFPAPVASCTLDTACAILEACWMALSKILPDRVPAGWNRWNGPDDHGHRSPVEQLLRHVRLQRVWRRWRHARAWTAGTTSATASTSAASSRRTSRPTRPTIPTSRSSTSSPRTPAARASAAAAAGRSTGSRCTTRTPRWSCSATGRRTRPTACSAARPARATSPSSTRESRASGS